jgi:formylmethanofuran dehydrogenase subunit E
MNNWMVHGKPADEYWHNRDEKEEKVKCEICNEKFNKDEVVEVDGDILCIDCRNEEVLDQEYRHGEKRG